MTETKEPKEPQFVGMTPDPTDPVAKYQAGVESRRAAVKEKNHQAGLPPISEVDAVWKSSEDGSATPAQLRDNLAALKGEKEAADTPTAGAFEGLRQTKIDADAANAAAEASSAKDEAGAKDFFKEVDKSAAEVADEKLADGVDAETEEQLKRMDKLKLTTLLNQIAEDPLNNDEQRALADAAADAHDPMDVGDVISRGEARQWVPINKGLRVLFRQTSPWEEQEIRKIIAAMVEKGDIPDTLSAEVYGLMGMVASVVQVNDNELASHVKKIKNTTEFDAVTFMRNYLFISKLPAGLTHSLSTHAWWFDRRARQLFTMDAVKNG